MDEKIVKYNSQEQVSLDKLREDHEYSFLELCELSGYLSTVFDYHSQTNHISGLEEALKLGKKLEGIPQTRIVDVFNKLEKAYLRELAKAQIAAKGEFDDIHGSVFDGAYESSHLANERVKDVSKQIENLPVWAGEFGLRREDMAKDLDFILLWMVLRLRY